MKPLRLWLMILLLTGVNAMTFAGNLKWTDQIRHLNREGEEWVVLGPDAWVVSQPLEKTAPPEALYLLVEVSSNQPIPLQIYYWNTEEGQTGCHFSRMATVNTKGNNEKTLVAADLATIYPFDGANQVRVGTYAPAGSRFQIHSLQFLTKEEMPEEKLAELIDFGCFTSKLHYQPGEPIPWKAKLVGRNYPDRDSSKILTVTITDDKGNKIYDYVENYGLPLLYNLRDLTGVFIPESPLAPGKYVLEAQSRDQRSGLILEGRHEFGVQGADDPYVCETPFKFVKDHSIIRDDKGIFHVFSITGELYGGHAWPSLGHERTFSHGTSKDLRHWTWHEPVLTIHDKKHPDGNEYYQNRNIWAPHVIKHDGMYYMFYTSINTHVSQSISVAMSKDLFNWVEYDKNPVLTLEGVEWALWSRDSWADLRDPMVWDDGGTFYMYATAHAKVGDPRGAVVVAESTDLFNWKNPQPAVRGNIVSESPQVWKIGDTYYMTTSSHGHGTYMSKHPAKGWEKKPFPMPKVRDAEKYVPTSGGYAEEVIRLDDNSLLMALTTWRHWGNSLYLFKMETDPEKGITGYVSPFGLDNHREH